MNTQEVVERACRKEVIERGESKDDPGFKSWLF
jgi:hypothetical protein